MAYTPVTFVDGVTPLNAAKMNQLEDGVESAHVIADAAIPKALVDAKGDIVVATGSDAPARLPVGANTQALLADSSQPTGLKWGVAGAALTYEGDHVGATSYDDGDIVVKDGIAYLCVGGPTTQTPNPVPWGPAGMMSGYQATSTKGVANGYASLGSDGKVPAAQLPGSDGLVLGGGVSLSGGAAWTALPMGNPLVALGSYVLTGDPPAHYVTVNKTGIYLVCGALAMTPTASGTLTIVIGSNKNDWQGGYMTVGGYYGATSPNTIYPEFTGIWQFAAGAKIYVNFYNGGVSISASLSRFAIAPMGVTPA